MRRLEGGREVCEVDPVPRRYDDILRFDVAVRDLRKRNGLVQRFLTPVRNVTHPPFPCILQACQKLEGDPPLLDRREERSSAGKQKAVSPLFRLCGGTERT